MTGGYLEWQVRARLVLPIIAFREYIFRDVLPHFDNLDQKSEDVGSKHYESLVSQPATEDFDGDLSSFAEDAQDRALGWYEMMRSLRQTMINLLAAGLFHLIEQQLCMLCRDAGFLVGPPKETALREVAKWYKSNLRFDLQRLPSWNLIDELRLVANTVKHAEGRSSSELKVRRPELFCDPAFASMASVLTEVDDYYDKKIISAPLAGDDLFVSGAILKMYAEGAEVFFGEIAEHFAAHEDDSY